MPLRCAFVLVVVLGAVAPSTAQVTKKAYVVKFDPLATGFGTFRFAAELTLAKQRYLYTAEGYFYRAHGSEEHPWKPAPERSRFRNLLRQYFKSRYNKWLYTAVGLTFRNPGNEQWLGPQVHLGLRQYFLTDEAPLGPYFQLGIGYQFLRQYHLDSLGEEDGRRPLHRPGIHFAGGYQRLFTIKRRYALDAFLGVDVAPPLSNTRSGTYNFERPGWVTAFFGLQIGFAFRRKNYQL